MAENPPAENPTDPVTAAPEVPAAAAAPGGADPAPASPAAGNGGGVPPPLKGKAPPVARRQPSAQVAVEIAELEEGGSLRFVLRRLVRSTPSWLVSMIVHVVVILLLALWSMPSVALNESRELVVAPGDIDEIESIEEVDDAPVDINITETELAPDTQIVDSAAPIESDQLESAPTSIELFEFGIPTAPSSDLIQSVGPYTGDALSGRSGEGRKRMAAQGGGTDASEAAVARALKWLAAHQLRDGGWSFNHTLAPGCKGQCRNPGGEMAGARNAATAMALLPFLGAGQTHETGDYKKVVKGGLGFLVGSMRVDARGGSLIDDGGRMYAHGLASIAICEAYAMTRDKSLYNPAQQAVNFICWAQDPIGGGWRYVPRTPGDTSVVGWQIMALKSGSMAYLRIPDVTVRKSFLYLDSVQANNGANYGYDTPGTGPATTAIGLLCRMYLGWKKETPALEKGVQWVSDRGPDKTNMYYNYYATQLMRHWDGPLWEKWNNVMRDQMINTQVKKGHEDGSWFTGSDHGKKAGRLYDTSLSTMVLEVYYRHLPIYRKQSTDEEFPLD